MLNRSLALVALVSLLAVVGCSSTQGGGGAEPVNPYQSGESGGPSSGGGAGGGGVGSGSSSSPGGM